MPRVTLHIRKEDWEKWKAIPSIPEWLHKHLNEENPDDFELVSPLEAMKRGHVTGGSFNRGGMSAFEVKVPKNKDEPHYENMEENA